MSRICMHCAWIDAIVPWADMDTRQPRRPGSGGC